MYLSSFTYALRDGLNVFY